MSSNVPRSDFDGVFKAIESTSPSLGKYGQTLKSTLRKLRDKCDPTGSDDFVLLLNNYEDTFSCLKKHTKTDKTLKSNISHMVGIFRRYAPGILEQVSSDAIKFWGNKISELDKKIRKGDPENDSGEDDSWVGLTWKKVVNAKRKMRLGTFERLAMDVYTSEGLPPRRGEWATVVVYNTQQPADKPPEQNWIYIPDRGAKNAFVEFNSFKTQKSVRSQRIGLPLETVKSIRETMKKQNVVFGSNVFGFDNYNAMTQANKFNMLLMRALNKSLGRTDIKRPANLFRHLFLTDLFHNRLRSMSDEELKTILRQMATSLEQAIFTYRIVEKEEMVGGADLPLNVRFDILSKMLSNFKL